MTKLHFAANSHVILIPETSKALKVIVWSVSFFVFLPALFPKPIPQQVSWPHDTFICDILVHSRGKGLLA